MTAELSIETHQIERNEVSIYLPPRLVLTPGDLRGMNSNEVGILRPATMTSAEYILETFVVAGATPIIRTYNHIGDLNEKTGNVNNPLEAAYILDNWRQLQEDEPDLVLGVHSYLGVSNQPTERDIGSQCLIFMDMECAPTNENLDWITQNLTSEGFTGAVIKSGNSFQYASDFRVPEKNLHMFLSELVGTLTPFFGVSDGKKIMEIINGLKGASTIQELRDVGRAIIDEKSELYVPSLKNGGKSSGSFVDLRYIGHRCSDESLGESIPFVLRLSGGVGKSVPYVSAIVK